MNNKFIIITPSYNNEDWVETYYESIVEQTYYNYKVIYFDDNSTDNTGREIQRLSKGNEKFVYIRNTANRGAAQNYMSGFEYAEDNDIILNLDGDDWFPTSRVLERLNNTYNLYDYWMSYGKMLVYDGTEDLKEGNPQNTPYHPFIHKHQFYRRDKWRASHLRAYRKFLVKAIDPKDFISKFDGKMFWHAHDLSLMFPMLEMCPPEKIGVIDFPTYVYNASRPARSRERESADNAKYETEIRNKKVYRRVTTRDELKGEKLPLINFIGDYKERNSIPTKCSFIYNQTEGEFDITFVQDDSIIKILNGTIPFPNGKVVADIHEPPYLFEQSKVYSAVKENASKFTKILTHNEELLKLPNAIFRNSAYEVVLNKNIHLQTYPILQDNSLIQLYPKNKMISFITSNKTFTDGHKFRLGCLNYLISKNCKKFDVFGVGIREIMGKIEALKDYRFSIAIENGKCKNYFTEKILDCFLTGTIPIYHGCPNINEFFDIRGFYTFETFEELLEIINSLTEKDYESRHEFVKTNFKIADQWWYDNNKFFDKYIKPLLK
jgi:glycosyltransferase involved in cell wall biosynthesis